MRPADTSREAWKVYLDIQRKMSPSEKLQRTLEWSDIVRQFAESGIRQRYPGASEHEVLLRFALLKLGPDLFAAVYGDVLNNDQYLRRHA